MRCFIVGLFVLACSGSAAGQKPVHRPELGALFEQAGVTGFFAIYESGADHYLASDIRRSKTRLCPASTFKICKSLIALQEGDITDVLVETVLRLFFGSKLAGPSQVIRPIIVDRFTGQQNGVDTRKVVTLDLLQVLEVLP